MKILKNKKLMVLFVILLIIIILGIIVLRMFLKTDNEPIYGSRLNGEEDYTISSENISNLKSDIGDLDLVESITYNLEGKLINIIINVDDSLEIDIFKEYGDKVLEYFTEEQKEYYDIQIFGESNNEESELYPIIGYKKNIIEYIRW